MITEITNGSVLVLVSLIGIAGCLIALIVIRPIFKRQRKEILYKIESE